MELCLAVDRSFFHGAYATLPTDLGDAGSRGEVSRFGIPPKGSPLPRDVSVCWVHRARCLVHIVLEGTMLDGLPKQRRDASISDICVSIKETSRVRAAAVGLIGIDSRVAEDYDGSTRVRQLPRRSDGRQPFVHGAPYLPEEICELVANLLSTCQKFIDHAWR
uniref:Uncharacterized protein n=1 Tax=Vespula pensylvanica TaxID=30213 RepID=A0A834JGR7_VESPE|nr:hypothetical protein H0235_018269 [Vespula pensylvanica]